MEIFNSISTASGEGAPLADYMEVDINNLTNAQSNASLFVSQGKRLVERFTRNRAISDQWHYILISIYIAMIIFGTVGNIFVVIAVVRKPIMRTARNLFILNLAISGECKLSVSCIYQIFALRSSLNCTLFFFFHIHIYIYTYMVFYFT